MSEINCPVCGTPHTIKANGVYWVACHVCQHLLAFTSNRLEDYGVTPEIPPVETPFWVGASGRLRGRPFEIVGRVHYRYADRPDDGYWDGWYICFEDNTAGIIITEDGDFYFYAPKQTATSETPDYDNLQVGSKLTVEGYDAEVVEIGVEWAMAISGQLPVYNVPDRKTQYVDCAVRNYIVNIDRYKDEKYVHFGVTLKPDEIEIHNNTES